MNRTPIEIESHRPVTFLVCFSPCLSLNISQKRYPRTETHMLWHMSSNFYFNLTDSWPLVSVSRRRCWWSGGWAAGCRGGSCSGRSSTASSCCTAAPPCPAPPDCLNQTCKQWLTMFRRRFNPSQSIVLLIPNIVKHRLHVCWTPNGGGNYPITRHNLLKDCGKNKWETISMLKHFYAKHTRLITGWKWEVCFADPAHGLVNRIRYSSGARSKMKWS